jgi:hypothetical protein
MFEMIKTWSAYISSLLLGAAGFVQKCNELADLVFVVLGCIGLILSIKLTWKKLKKYQKE